MGPWTIRPSGRTPRRTSGRRSGGARSARRWSERRRRLFRASQLIALLLIVTVAAGVVLRLPESWWMPAVGAIALLGIVFRLADWKCPNCGERLRTRRSSSVCLGCGAPLE